MKYLVKHFCLIAISSIGFAHVAFADIVHNDDVIAKFSHCVGNDCVNGENFGFDTMRLKENNLRIHFQDTSTSASFPSNDWRLVANDTSNGGNNYFAIEDSNTARIPFLVEAGAQDNNLYVEADGDIGIKTANPVVDLHIVEGNTPTIRLEQDGSDGFTPQTWDIAGNESNFFLRDATNGSKLFFRSKPGAPEDSIFIAADGKIGFGTDVPASSLHIKTNSNPQVALQNTADNNGQWRFSYDNGGQFRISKVGSGFVELALDAAGNLTVSGDVFSTTCAVGTPCAPDYVFEDNYHLLPLSEVKEFIERESHLPDVPSAKELTGPISINQMQMTLLRKVEELTLYTLQQQERIEQLESQVATKK